MAAEEHRSWHWLWVGLLCLALPAHSSGAEDAVEVAGTDPIYFRYCGGAILRAAPEHEPGSFALALLRGADWAPYGRAIYDAEGQLLRQEVAGRGDVIFEPHNCEKSVGICAYTETAFGGAPQRKLRITGHEGADADWNYSLIDLVRENGADNQVLTRVGTVTYADDGLAIRETWSSITGTEDGCLERIDPGQLPPAALTQ